MGNEGSVISEEIMEQLLKCFCLGMQSPEVKKVFRDLFEHHVKKDPEQSRCQNTILFHAVDDGEGSREVTVTPNLAALVFVELDNHAEDFGGAAKALHNHPQSLSALGVKGCGQVHKCYIQSFV